MNVKRLVRPNVRALQAYQAKDVPCRVKLDANESPYGFPLLQGLEGLASNRYPDPEACALRKLLARRHGLAPENVLVGNGSDELIYYIVTTFGGPVLSPVPTFVMYDIIARALGETSATVALDPAFDLDMKAALGLIRKLKPKVVFISSPNNPTGNSLSADRIRGVIEAARSGVVVVDEAYQPFARGRGFVPELAKYPNLLVMRTLSKVGLAALRVGYLLGGADAISEVNKVRLPFNLNSLSQAMAVRALGEKGEMRRAIAAIVKERKRLMLALSGMAGVTPYPSDANFILMRVRNAGGVHAGLLRRGVLVRNLGGIAEGCLRVTVGTPNENDAFLAALQATLAARGQDTRGKRTGGQSK